MRSRAKLLAVAAASLAGVGCLNADVNTHQVCVSSPEQIPGSLPGLKATQTFTVTFDLSGAFSNLNQSGVSGTVLMQQIEISTADTGGVDLSTVQSVSATILPSATSDLAPVDLTCQYAAPASPPLPLTSIVVPCSGSNIFDYVKDQALTLEIAVTASDLPPTSWQADVGACVSAEIVVDYTQL